MGLLKSNPKQVKRVGGLNFADNFQIFYYNDFLFSVKRKKYNGSQYNDAVGFILQDLNTNNI